MTTLHAFEKAGLGIAPFRCIGVQENWYSAAPDHKQPGGHCAFCFTSIAYEYVIKDVKGKMFVVGCECVRRTGGEKLIEGVREFRLQHARKKREAGHAKRRAERQAIWASERAWRNAEFVAAEPEIAAMLDKLALEWETMAFDADYHRRNYFLYEMAGNVSRWGSLTAGQLAAVKANIARNAQHEAERAASQFVGEEKQRISGEFEIISVRESKRPKFGASWKSETVYWHLMKFGADFVTYYGTVSLGSKGERVKLKCTVQEHEIYKGCRQTRVGRPTIVRDESKMTLRDQWGNLVDAKGHSIPDSKEFANVAAYKAAKK